MATVVLAKEFQKGLSAVEGSLKPRAWDLLRKLSADADLTGLDLKAPRGARDPRVRTARVTDNYRAVLFAAGQEHDQYFLLVAIRPHDEAYAYAARITMRLNPANGVFEVLRGSASGAAPSAHTTPAVPRTGRSDRPPLLPFTAAELAEVGILPELADRAVAVSDEDALQELCLDAPEWQARALLDLAFGASLKEVRDTYGRSAAASAEPDSGLPAAEPPRDADDPRQLRESLNQPASQMEFVIVEGDEHLRQMLDGDFAAWRTFLHPDQRALVERDRNGPYRVAGGAGTGKTVVAMHRAVHLAARSPQARVLVTTFTRNLAAELKLQLARLAGPEASGRIEVLGIDQLARWVVSRADGGAINVLNGRDERRQWERAIAAATDLSTTDRQLMTSYFLQDEYRHVILGQGVTELTQYLSASRQGRGARLNRLQRARVWQVVEEFNRQLAVDNRTTYAVIAARAADLASSDDTRPKSNTYDHVVIDEGQDLSPAHWRLLRGVVARGPNDIFLCEDAHQRIYGERVVLSRYGIETRGRSERLTLNYRTTRQVLRYATGILRDGAFHDLDGDAESTSRYRSLLAGPTPTVRGFPDRSTERAFVVGTVRSWLEQSPTLEPASLAVLVHDVSVRDEVARALQEAGVPTVVVNTDGESASAAVQVATMHRAKGTEFARVVVAGAGAEAIPSAWRLEQATDDGERAEIEQRERCLLYVACTRARDELVVTYTGEPSRFLPFDSVPTG